MVLLAKCAGNSLGGLSARFARRPPGGLELLAKGAVAAGCRRDSRDLVAVCPAGSKLLAKGAEIASAGCRDDSAAACLAGSCLLAKGDGGGGGRSSCVSPGRGDEGNLGEAPTLYVLWSCRKPNVPSRDPPATQSPKRVEGTFLRRGSVAVRLAGSSLLAKGAAGQVWSVVWGGGGSGSRRSREGRITTRQESSG